MRPLNGRVRDPAGYCRAGPATITSGGVHSAVRTFSVSFKAAADTAARERIARWGCGAGAPVPGQRGADTRQEAYEGLRMYITGVHQQDLEPLVYAGVDR